MGRSCCRRWNGTASNIPEDERRLKILEVIGRQLYRIEDVTLRDEQILPPVIVEIDPPDAPARIRHRGVGDASLRRREGKDAPPPRCDRAGMSRSSAVTNKSFRPSLS